MAAGMNNHNQKASWSAVLIIVGILVTVLFCGCIEPETEADDVTTKPLQNTTQDIKTPASTSEPADITLKVVKFEPPNPCKSCTNLGNFAKETIELYFPAEYKSGRISYETVNFQDPESIDMIKKYSISGSSLYITVIKNGKEEIIDANDMWNYVWNKEEYMIVFKDKLDAIINE